MNCPQKVPATIHSRCQRFDFRSVPTQIIADHLANVCKKEKIKADQDALRFFLFARSFEGRAFGRFLGGFGGLLLGSSGASGAAPGGTNGMKGAGVSSGMFNSFG